ncbi:MAG: hypothetical protein U9Q82_11900 [Chloroflexota bacterium]|nr:hypothetical protein [Chloroflexota bacterium]
MSRVINPNPPGKTRNRLKRAVSLSLRELMGETEPSDRARDLAAFIVLSLDGIAKTVDTTVTAWEKRDYWIKADRFHMEWVWAENLGAAMRKAVLAEDWGQVAQIAAKVGQELSNVSVSKRHRMGTPWVGAWEKLQEK